VDDVIIFRPLSSQDIAKIVDLQIKRFERLMAERKLRLEVTPAPAADRGGRLRSRLRGAAAEAANTRRLVQNPLAMPCSKAVHGKATRYAWTARKTGTI